MSNINTGTEIGHALVKSSVWGTATQAGAGRGIELTGQTLSHTIESIPDNSLGRPHLTGADKGNTKVEGALESNARYADLLGLALVAGSSPAPVASGTITYTHTITPADSVDGLYATFIEKRKSYTLESELKPTGFTLYGEAGRAMNLRLAVLGFDLVEDSSVNTTSTFANVTIPDTGNRLLFADSVVRMNVASGAALGSGDVIYPNRIEFSYKRSLRGLYTGQYTVTRGQVTTGRIDEPVNAGPAIVTLRLNFPSNSDALLLTDFKADVAKKIDLVFTGRQIESGFNRKLSLEIPDARITSMTVFDSSRGRLIQSAQFTSAIPASPPSGMSAITTPWRIKVTNANSASYLA